ncbi:MAG: DUF1330 domain-containing protein [Moraxellaceae bacterium]|nr:DUF1330 domain-containing protein [Moraxellaceae bacterium]
MTHTIDPVASQLPSLLAALPQDTPLLMLNLLRFRAEAMYRDGVSRGSGAEAYARYAAIATKKVGEVGGELRYRGTVKGMLIGPEDEAWDEVLLVRYPSVAAFKSMLGLPDYRDATRHRTAALENARLIATVELA